MVPPQTHWIRNCGGRAPQSVFHRLDDSVAWQRLRTTGLRICVTLNVCFFFCPLRPPVIDEITDSYSWNGLSMASRPISAQWSLWWSLLNKSCSAFIVLNNLPLFKMRSCLFTHLIVITQTLHCSKICLHLTPPQELVLLLDAPPN